MKKLIKIVSIIMTVALIAVLSVCLFACGRDDRSKAKVTVYRFTAPQGTPALAMLRLVKDNTTIIDKHIEYEVVNPENIALEMTSKKSDIIIMPVNAGANLIRQGIDYKLVSVAVEGSLFMIGNKAGSNTLTMDDIKGKKIACIGQTGVPGLVFRYVMSQNNVKIVTSGVPSADEVLVQYVGDATVAKGLLENHTVDFAVVGEPAATQFKNMLGLNAEMDMQTEYARVNPDVNGDSYPQAGLFVKASIASNTEFMNALFEALQASKDWVVANPASVTEFAKANLYKTANFPTPSIPRCAISCSKLSEESKNEIIAFLKNVMPKDSEGKTIDWDGAKSKLF